jgi:hypothetical protein
MAETQTATEAEKKLRRNKRLEYPLNNPDDYLGRLVFTVLEEPPTELGNIVGTVTKAGEALASRVTGTVQNVIGGQDVDDAAVASRTPEQKKKEEDAVNGFLNIPVKGERQLIDTGNSVSMYLPAGLQFRDTVNYDNMDIGSIGATTEMALRSGVGVAESLVKGGMSSISNMFTGSQGGDLAQLGSMKLAAKIPLEEIRGGFRSVGRVTTNPNTRVLFKSVNLREFSFAFKFIATSAREAEEVKSIIKFFRTELYPENINLDFSNGNKISVGYKFPNKFRIEALYDNEPIATRLKPCYLKDVSVTYNPNGMQMHDDGNFMEVEMTLAFQESRTLSREDIEGNDDIEGGF